MVASDDLLRGTSNEKVVRTLRDIAPHLVIITNSITMEGVGRLYRAGADYVYLQRVETAIHLAPALVAAMEGEIRGFRAAQDTALGPLETRREVVP